MEQPTKAEDLVADIATWTKNAFLPVVVLLVGLAMMAGLAMLVGLAMMAGLAMMLGLAMLVASRFCSMAGLPLPPAGEDDRMICVVCLERERQVSLKTKRKLFSFLAFSEYLLHTSAVFY